MDKRWRYGEKDRNHHDSVLLVGVQFTKTNMIKKQWKDRIEKYMDKFHNSFLKMKECGHGYRSKRGITNDRVA